jgi:hypothetical protein
MILQTRRHPVRPARMHFLVDGPGYEPRNGAAEADDAGGRGRLKRQVGPPAYLLCDAQGLSQSQILNAVRDREAIPTHPISHCKDNDLASRQIGTKLE